MNARDILANGHKTVLSMVEGLSEERFRRNGTLLWYGSSYSLDDLLV